MSGISDKRDAKRVDTGEYSYVESPLRITDRIKLLGIIFK